MAILAYRLAKIFAKNPAMQMVRISWTDLPTEDSERA